MPRPRAGADSPYSRLAPKEAGQPLQVVRFSPSDSLHLALAAALGLIILVAIAFPLTRSGPEGEDSSSTPVLVVSNGVSATFYSQAHTLLSALTQAGPAATPQDPLESPRLDGFPGASLVPRPLLVAAAGVLVQGALVGPDGDQRLVMELQQPVRFTLHEGGFASAVFSTRPTVGGALAALGVPYNPYDRVLPAPDTPLTAGLHVFVDRGTAAGHDVDGEQPEQKQESAPEAEPTPEPQPAFTVYTVQPGDSVASIADSFGIDIDYVVSSNPDVQENPGLLAVGQELRIPSVNGLIYDVEQGDTLSGIASFYHIDVQSIVDYAPNGITLADAIYEGMVLLLPGAVPPPPPPPPAPVYAPVTAVAAAVTAPEGDLQCARTMTVYATWYTAASAGGFGFTATGTVVQKGTVAVDPRVIPLGTRMYIPGYGYGTAEDTGGAIIGNIIDLGYGPDDVYDWRTRYVDICILN